MRSILLLLFLLVPALVLSTPLPAQTPPGVVLPNASYATNPGPRNNNIPFSWQPTRYQQLFHNQDVGSKANLFNNLQLRPNNNYGSPSYGGHMVNLTIKLGPTTVAPSAATGTFATNNPTPITVLDKVWVQMPRFRTFNVTDWQVTIPFARPFPWPGGTNHFCVEVVNWMNTNQNALFTYPLDATNTGQTTRIYASGNPTAATGSVGMNYGLIMRFCTILSTEAWFQDYGSDCPGSTNQPMIMIARDAPRLGLNLEIALIQGPPSGSAILGYGRNRSRWGPLALPFDLTPFGARGCSLNCELLGLVTTPISASGDANQQFTLPNVPGLLGSRLCFQWLANDAQANPLGLITSQGGEARLGQ